MGHTISDKGFKKADKPVGIKCAHCDRLCGNFAGGYAGGHNGENLCHPNVSGRPDCYRLVTVYGHKTPCTRKTCYQDHDDPKKYIGRVKTSTPF
jgi:hypothetical protein